MYTRYEESLLLGKLSLGRRIFLMVTLLFGVFAMAFMAFQHSRERQYKVDALNARLQSYNVYLAGSIGKANLSEQNFADFVSQHHIDYLRLTVISEDGRVLFDNQRKDYAAMGNHSNRPEVVEALHLGSGAAIDRKSGTTGEDYFYSATYLPEAHLLVRSALPYNNRLAESLQGDMHYIWFALSVLAVLVVLMWRYMGQLDRNMRALELFAQRAADGESLDVEELSSFSSDELGALAERIVTMHKTLETTRQQQDVLKRELTQNISHELKTPVSGILGYLETMQNHPSLDEATRCQFVDRCLVQANRLRSLIADLSTLNRITEAPQLIEKDRVCLDEVVKKVCTDFEHSLKQREMTLADSVDTDLYIDGNSELLDSVFRNLISNSVAYAGLGSHICIESERMGNFVLIRFSDNGPGVSPEHLPRLFERFYRVDKGRSRKMGGTGLGLSIVQHAVKLHGGDIKVSNRTEGGLLFSMTFPLAVE